MQRILLAQAKEGMVLAREIETPEGRILCGKGTELSEGLISRLSKMDIVSLTVEGHPVADPGSKSLAEEMAEIEERFSRVNNIPPLHYIKNRLLQQLQNDAQNQSTDGPEEAAQAAPQGSDPTQE